MYDKQIELYVKQMFQLKLLPATMGPEVISMQDGGGPLWRRTEVMSTSCVDVMITLCGVTLRALNPSDVTLRVVVWRRK